MKHRGRPRSDEDWQRCQALIVRQVFPPTRLALRLPHFARQVEKIFRELFPLYAFATQKTAR